MSINLVEHELDDLRRLLREASAGQHSAPPSPATSLSAPGAAIDRVHVVVGRVATDPRLGRTNLSTELLVLDRTANDPLDLVVGGRLVARGELLEVAGSVAIRISELLIPGAENTE